MALQEEISMERNQQKIGKTFKVLIDRLEDGNYYGRTEFDSPEVDNEVIIKQEQTLEIGEFYSVLIDDADPFDLRGHIV